MPKISTGGVTDVNVDPDYVAPPGVAPADAIDRDLPDAATDVRPSEQDEDEKEDESSPGKTSSPQSTKRKPSTSAPIDASKTRSNARSTTGRSNERPKESSTARTADTSSRPGADQG